MKHAVKMQTAEGDSGSAPEQTTGEPKKPLKPHQCRAYMRRQLAEEFPAIVSGFLKSAREGSCNHVKLATEFLEPRPRVRRPGNQGTATLQRLARRMDEIND